MDGDGFVDYQELSARVRLQRTPSARYRSPRNEAEKLDLEVKNVAVVLTLSWCDRVVVL